MKRITTFFLLIVLFLLGSVTALAWGTSTGAVVSALANPSAPAAPGSVHLLQNVEQIAMGAYHSCALIGLPPTSGGVKCWGDNSYGQLGDNTTTTHNLPVDSLGLTSGIKAVVAGANHTCALNSTGGVRCWGLNEFGQLGDGTLQSRRIPADVQGLSSGVLALSAGDHHTCARLATGVKCWGANNYGQLGDGTFAQHNTPVDVSGLPAGVIQIAAGGNHTCAVTNSNGLKCWGNNDSGQLGDGTTVLSRTIPVDVVGLGSNVTIVSLGESHTCAVVNGGARCWGTNSDGQLGDGSGSDTNTAVNVFNLSSAVSGITTGEKHSCALLNSGGVKCWGRNANGEAGDTPNNYNITMPVDVVGLNSDVVEVAAGARHTCARMNSGSLKCWGLNEGGQLGDGVSYLYTTPVTVTGLSGTVNALAVGGNHSCALLNGEAKCWGENGYQQLGNPVFGASAIPVDVAITGVTLTRLAAGDDHTCVLAASGGTGGGLKCWGGNYWGQLGGGDNEYTDQIIDVIGLTTGVMTFTTRVDHTCALVAGNAKCWGHNEYGQLGNGDTDNHATPVNVTGVPDGELSDLATGGFHSCALTKRGGVLCWGFNQQGELGTGTTSLSETTPVTVTGLVSGVAQVAAGMYHSCALLTSGGVKCWGVNDYGQVGDNSNKTRYTPVDVANLTSGVKAITAGFYYTCALLNSGEIKCWGQNESGQLGDGTLVNRSAPVTTIGLDGIATRIATGAAHTCAVMSLGGIQCWGNGVYGQLGNGKLAWRHTPADVLVVGDFLTPTVTSTPTPTSTSSTPTPTAPTSTPTATEPPSGDGDAFENDDTCAKARTIASDGSIQIHTFHKNADADWVHFDSVAGKEYIIDVNIPADSLADVTLEIYPACDGLSLGGQDYAYSPGVRLQWKAETNGPIHLKLNNNDADIFGAQVRYEVSVRAKDESAKPGALILVAGAIKNNDTVQPNIYHVTDAVYKLFTDKGYTDDRIYYLAPDRSHSAKVDATSTRANLQAAIQEWAKEYVGSDRALTLYLMDHGAKELFYLDKQRGEWVSPDDLNSWLNNLETATPGLAVNVIIEACFSGSFITTPGSLSKPGRVVVTSTDDNNLAWASQEGARFSDHLLPALARGDSLYSSYRQAQIAAQISHPNQAAWIDGDGDGNPHDSAEQSVAVRRGFNFPGSLPDLWPPYIAKTYPPTAIEDGRGLLRANVRDDDNAVSHVWAVIYPPSYAPPTTGDALVQEALATVTLLVEGNDWYRAYYDGFRENGTYRVVIYADDAQDLEARPLEMLVEINNGSRVFLPLVVR